MNRKLLHNIIKQYNTSVWKASFIIILYHFHRMCCTVNSCFAS